MEEISKYESIAIEEVCRICLTKNDNMRFISQEGIPEMILDCASIQITPEENMHLLCNYCSNEICKWFEFKQRVVKSFEIGRWLFKYKIDKFIDKEFQQTQFVDIKQYTTLNPVDANLGCIESYNDDVSNSNFKVESNQYIIEQTFDEPLINLHSDISQDNKDITVLKPIDSINEGIKEEVDPCYKSENIKKIVGDSFVCELCGKTFNSHLNLNKHLKTHNSIKVYNCSKCVKSFKQPHALTDHMQRHYDVRKFACEVCGKKFYKQFNVNEHMRIHTGERPFVCELCHKTFTRGLLLRNHIKKIHSDFKKYICSYCDKSFVDGYQLKIHTRIHTGEKPYKCDYCTSSFAIHSQLKSHIKYKHTKEKDFICNFCGKAFTAKHTLEEHLRTHTGEKKPPKHECTICKKKCITSTQLKIHIRSQHTGERPYVCSICSKTFVTKTILEGHVRTHSGEKSYVCQECGKGFSAKCSLKVHERIHTGEKPFSCNVCGKKFSQGSTLKTHLKTHNNTIEIHIHDVEIFNSDEKLNSQTVDSLNF